MLQKVVKRKEIEQGVPEEQTRKITFDDYEAFLDRLEKEGKLDSLKAKNPKARRDQIDEEWLKMKKHIEKDLTKNT